MDLVCLPLRIPMMTTKLTTIVRDTKMSMTIVRLALFPWAIPELTARVKRLRKIDVMIKIVSVRVFC